MALKPFWIKKFHTKLSDKNFRELLAFTYRASYDGNNPLQLSAIVLDNEQTDAQIVMAFEKLGDKLFCTSVGGGGWNLGNEYAIPITNEEAQTLLSTGTLVQSIDNIEEKVLLSSIVVKNFAGFYGTLHTIQGLRYCSGVVYEPTLTQKLYFVYIIVDLDNTATWHLIPIT